MDEFSFPKWYPAFERDSVEAIVIPIPNDVLNYLCLDSMVLPAEASVLNVTQGGNTEQNYSVDWTKEDESDELEVPTFPTFSSKLKDAMNTLGGEVFIKANWHAPSDASWIVPGRTLKCTNLQDMYLLLKASDIVGKDLCQFEASSENGPCVVMKQWIELDPGCEFRCFVKEHQLFAVSQRDHRSYYEHINDHKYDILKDIVKFFKRKIKRKFPQANYVFDIARIRSQKIVIIDFQPLDKAYTDSLLFSWEELDSLNLYVEEGEEAVVYDPTSDDVPEEEQEVEPEFRFIAEDPGLQRQSCQISGLPFEFSQLCSSMCNVRLEEMEELFRQQHQNGGGVSDSDHDDYDEEREHEQQQSLQQQQQQQQQQQ